MESWIYWRIYWNKSVFVETYHGLFGVDLLWSSASNLLDDGSYVGWSVQVKFGETGLVGLNQPLNTCSSVKRENVASMAALAQKHTNTYVTPEGEMLHFNY